MTIWKLLNNGSDLSIAMSTRDGPQPSSSKRTTFSEVLAMSDVFTILEHLSIRYRIINDNSSYQVRRQSNILSVGGEKANAVTVNIWNMHSESIPIKLEKDPYAIVVGEKKYITEYNGEDTISKDYGIVLVICSCHEENKMSCQMVAFGLRGFGTRGAIQSISSSDLIKRFKRYSKNNSFLAVICTTGNNEELETSVEEFYALDSYP